MYAFSKTVQLVFRVMNSQMEHLSSVCFMDLCATVKVLNMSHSVQKTSGRKYSVSRLNTELKAALLNIFILLMDQMNMCNKNEGKK